MDCNYCGQTAHLVTGQTIYPHRPDLFDKQFYQCVNCAAWVGCHAETARPLGRLANAELRRAKSLAHAAFDPLWRNSDKSRKDWYNWLATQLNITPAQCHIGMFDTDMCRMVIQVCLNANINKSHNFVTNAG